MELESRVAGLERTARQHESRTRGFETRLKAAETDIATLKQRLAEAQETLRGIDLRTMGSVNLGRPAKRNCPSG